MWPVHWLLTVRFIQFWWTHRVESTKKWEMQKMGNAKKLICIITRARMQLLNKVFLWHGYVWFKFALTSTYSVIYLFGILWQQQSCFLAFLSLAFVLFFAFSCRFFLPTICVHSLYFTTVSLTEVSPYIFHFLY